MLGVWLLRSREDYDAQGNRHIDPFLGPDPLGILTFAPHHFAAQFMNRDRTGAPVDGPAGANNSAAVNGYDAYFGTYTLDLAAGNMITTLEGSVSPANVGMVFTRAVRVAGDRLYIQLATTTPSGVAVTRTLVWERAGQDRADRAVKADM
jgi:hypothetical protein